MSSDDKQIRSALVYGAGSIGNHLSRAARTLGWDVTACDLDAEALRRMREEIYPGRYGAWDSGIRQLLNSELGPGEKFDCVMVGTPPDSHMLLLRDAVSRARKVILVEKPLATPSLDGCAEAWDQLQKFDGMVFVGYDHVVGAAAVRLVELIYEGVVGELKTLDVEFREFWGGIFGAHPWLEGPWDTYLGFSSRGGGAAGEHSHATNLWQHLAHETGAGRVVEVDARCRWVRDGRVDYDELCALTLTTESGLVGRVVQDVVTVPVRKWASVQGTQGRIEWVCGAEPGVDVVRFLKKDGTTHEERFVKTRPDDFLAELRAIQDSLNGGVKGAGIEITRGFDTQLVVAAALESDRTRRSVCLDYSQGYTQSALQRKSID